MPNLKYPSVRIPKRILIQSDEKHIEMLKKRISSLAKTGVIKEKKKGIYELTLSPIKTMVPKLLTNSTFGEISGRKEAKEQIFSFKGNKSFYNFFEKTKGIGIITDEFSNFRNKKIYEGFMSIEEKIKELIIFEPNGNIGGKKPPFFREEKVRDHIICQYELSELFELFLYCPASDTFIKEKWRESDKSEESLSNLLKLQKRDELSFPLTKDELWYFKNVRNKCMHFRTISVDEYSATIEIINKYLKFDFEKQINITLTPFIEGIIEAQKSATKVISEYQSIMKPYIEVARSYQESFRSVIAAVAKQQDEYQSIIKNLWPTNTNSSSQTKK